MKAIDMLTWMVNQTITTEGMGFVPVTDDMDFESFFGYAPEGEVPEGEYLYFYGDQVMTDDVELLTASTGEAPYRIPTKEKDEKNGGNMIIYLVKLED